MTIPRQRFTLLRNFGVLDALERAGARPDALYRVTGLLRHSGVRSPNDLTRAHIDRYFASHSLRPELMRSRRRTVVRTLALLGIDAESLGAPALIERAHVTLPPQIEADLARFRDYLVEQRFTRAGKHMYGNLAIATGRWLLEQPETAGRGLFECFQDDDFVFKFVLYSARPKTNGQARSLKTFLQCYDVIRCIWRASGTPADRAASRLAALQARTRRDGKAGPPQKLELRSADPAKGPPLEEFIRFRESLDRDIADERSRLATGTVAPKRLRALLKIKVMTLVLSLVGMRFESLCSLRLDQITRDRNGLWTAVVLVKNTPLLETPPTPRWPVGDQWYVEWRLWPCIVDAIEELCRAYSFSFLDFEATGNRASIPWLTVTEDATYGNSAPVGSVVSPLWLDATGSTYLTKNNIGHICERVVRERLGRPRGRVHIFRRLAALLLLPLCFKNPAASRAILQMSTEMQLHYARNVDYDLVGIMRAFDPFTGALPGSLVEDALDPIAVAPSGMAPRSAMPPKRSIVSVRPQVAKVDATLQATAWTPSLEDLFGGER